MDQDLWKSVFLLLLVFLLIPVCKEDLRSQTIPNRWPLLLGGAGFLQAGITPVLVSSGVSIHTSILFSAAGALAATGLGLLCRGISREGFGWGDVKLLTGLGAYLGLFPFLRSMAVTGVLSLVAALYLVLVRHARANEQIPFAPFLAAGAILSEGMEWFVAGG